MFGDKIVVQNPRNIDSGVYGIGQFEVAPEHANWTDLILPENSKHDFLETDYLKQKRLMEMRRTEREVPIIGNKIAKN